MRPSCYDTFDPERDGMAELDAVLGAARAGCPAVLRHRGAEVAVIDAGHLRRLLAERPGSRAELVQEAGGFVALIPGGPTSGAGSSPDGALDDLVVALREYAEDWRDHLYRAPNHRSNWPLVQLVALSDDEQLRACLVGTQLPAAPRQLASLPRG